MLLANRQRWVSESTHNFGNKGEAAALNHPSAAASDLQRSVDHS
jgi:hypothetical protein